MRKIYSLVLMATMLLLGTTAWADTYSVGDGGDYATFSAFWSAQGASLSNADEVTILSAQDLNAGTYDFQGAALNCNTRLKMVDASDYTIQNAVVTSTTFAFLIGAAANVSLENVQITSTTTATDKEYNKAAIYCNTAGKGSTLTIDADSEIKCSASSSNTIGYGIYTVEPMTIVNNGTIADVMQGIYYNQSTAQTDSLIVINNGTIRVYAKSGAEGYYITSLLQPSRIVNNGTLTAGTTYARGIQAKKSKIINNGSITSTSTSTSMRVLNCGASCTIENNGTMDRIYASATVTVTNSGTLNNIMFDKNTRTANISNTETGIFNLNTDVAGNLNITNAGTLNMNKATYSGTISLTNDGIATISAGTHSETISLTNNGTATITGGTYNAAVSIENNNTATISGGTYKGAVTFAGSNNTNITGGSFSAAPLGSMGYINPGDGAIKFAEGVGSLTIAPGYVWRSIDKYVAPETGVVEVTHANGSTATCLIEEAFANAADGDVITLLEDVTSYSSLWLGTEDMDGAYKSVTLDLNGHTLYSAKNVTRTITLTHGALYIINSVPGQGGIAHMRSNAAGKSSDIIYVTGSTLKTVNPRTAEIANLFTYLLVDEGVNITSNGDFVNGVTLSEIGSSNTVSQVNYTTDIYKNYLNWEGKANTQMGVANGVRIDIKGTIDVQKYGVKPNGNVRSPLEFLPEHAGDGIAVNDTSYSAYIHIFPTAVVRTAADVESATAIYASGYARWLIEGTCQGATGVYAKSGVIDFNDAIVESTYTGEATITTGKGSGIEAGGNAVVVESNGAYTGGHSLVVNGDTRISTEAEGGAAIVDVVDDTHDSKVESIVINGGSFTGDNAIVISSETATDESTTVTVNGVTVVGEITVGESSAPEDVAAIMGSNTHTTEVENPDGSKTVIISAGEAPAAKTEWVDVAALTSGSDANWTGLTPGVIGDGTTPTTIKLGELQIISGSSTNGVQQLTVKDKAVLNVDRLIMNDYARIIVEAGGKLIVEGTQGINAPNAENILLQTSEAKQAIFLFNPSVSSNRHPNATVQLSSSSYRNSADDRHNHRFGIPMISGVSSIEATPAVPTAFYKFDYANDSWLHLGYINHPTYGDNVDLTEIKSPFEYYQLLCNVPSGSTTTFTFTGNLVGNDNPSKTIEPDVWYGIANSYTGEMDLTAIVNSMEGTMAKTIWTYETSGPKAWAWKVANLATAIFDGIDKIKPMQAFLIHNVSDDESATTTISYKQTVWDPAMNPSPAPARVSTASLTAAKLIVSSENGYGDQVLLVQGNDFTSAYDNGYDAEKYFNGDINFYISDSRAMSVLATDDLRDTYLGFSCVNGGLYTIDFSNIQGEQYDLIDLEANRTIHMAEGASYQFAANDNEQNDYRFRIVERQEMPTNMEMVETTMPANDGVYTLTGQYLGDLNIWNTLPAGLYIVNGEKKVK